jgi:hypothetical protein
LWKGGYITVEIVNNRLREIFSKTSVDKKDKPCELNSFLPPGQGISPKFSAAQMCTFFRYLPMMLAPYIDPKNEHWRLFLMLQEVVDLVFAPRLPESTLGYFELLYSEFLCEYKTLYPEIPVKPKMHFLVHLPTTVRQNGPQKVYWTMGFERLNGAIKRPSHIMNNFKNSQKTLAYRQQCAALSQLVRRKQVTNSILVTRSFFVNMEEFETYRYYNEVFPLLSKDSEGVEISEKLSYNSTDYKKGSFVILRLDENGTFEFGEIHCIVRERPEQPLLVTKVFKTRHFDQHSFSYCVEKAEPTAIYVSSLQNFVDYHPLDGIRQNEKTHIRLKYSVLDLKKSEGRT